MARLAYTMWRDGVDNIEEDNLARKFNQSNQEVYHIFQGSRRTQDYQCLDYNEWVQFVGFTNNSAGILIRSEDGYAFQNELFQHYLAAKWLWTCLKLERYGDLEQRILLQPRHAAAAQAVPEQERWLDKWTEMMVMTFTTIVNEKWDYDEEVSFEEQDRMKQYLVHYIVLVLAYNAQPPSLHAVLLVIGDVCNERFGSNGIYRDRVYRTLLLGLLEKYKQDVSEILSDKEQQRLDIKRTYID